MISYTNQINTVLYDITISEANKKQGDLLDVILNFNHKVRTRSKADKERKRNTYEGTNSLYEGQELTLNAFGIFPLKSGILPLNSTQGKGRKILVPINKCFKNCQQFLHQYKQAIHLKIY